MHTTTDVSTAPTTGLDDADERAAHESLLEPRPHWKRQYAARLVVTDAIALVWAIVGAALVTIDPSQHLVAGVDLVPWRPTYVDVAVLVATIWLVALAAVGSRHYRRIGTGSAEFKAVAQSALVVLVVLSLISYTLKVEFSRAFVFTALPTALAALMLSRLLWRRWLNLHRLRGVFCSRVVLVGSVGPVRQVAAELRRHPEAGYLVVGAIITGGPADATAAGSLPVLGTSSDDLLAAVERAEADTVVVTDGHNLEPHRLRELSWSLEPGRQHLVMAPSLTDIAGPRIHSRPVAGLPLVHVETPRYEGSDRFVKRTFDIVVSAGLLLVLAMPLAVISILVVTTSPGGLFYAHERIGKGGRSFRMLKFRSMVAGADDQLDRLLAEQGRADTPLFKVVDDPRITSVGRVLRRYSLDEVPQLLNVLRGDMSLVGPRPQVAKEVALYDDAAARRLFVHPGMTGLWQVSGRSNLGWDESLRLDLYYVENWSLFYDVSILLRTVRAVLRTEGAV